MSNMPTITFYLNGSSKATTVNYSTSNPLVKFDSTDKSNGLVQPPNWYYYLMKYGSYSNFTISIVAAENYPLPAISFMLSGPGGAAGLYGSTCQQDGNIPGGNGGGGGSGAVSLINNYYSGVNSTSHSVNLAPIPSNSNGLASELHLDTNNANLVFYAYSGSNGGDGKEAGSQENILEPNYGSCYNGDAGDGGSGGSGSALSKPNQNFLPSYCGIVRGGAGGNGGLPTNNTKTGPGDSYNNAVIPTGSDQLGNAPVAYVPVTFADGLSIDTTIVTGGYGGYSTKDPASGTSGPGSMFMLYFCL